LRGCGDIDVPSHLQVPGGAEQQVDVVALGEKPQHVYSVRFSARELWGDQAAVYVELWDDYLEPA
jgi:hypothetical protein